MLSLAFIWFWHLHYNLPLDTAPKLGDSRLYNSLSSKILGENQIEINNALISYCPSSVVHFASNSTQEELPEGETGGLSQTQSDHDNIHWVLVFSAAKGVLSLFQVIMKPDWAFVGESVLQGEKSMWV